MEYRQPIGFDSPLGACGSSCDFTRGVLIHRGNTANRNSSYIIDPTPGTTNPNMIALLPGQSFSDPNAPNGGVTIITNSVNNTVANIVVRFGTTTPCTRNLPTVTINPSSIQNVRPGMMRNYNIEVTNNDSTGCPPALFTYSVPLSSTYMGRSLSITSTVIDAGKSVSFNGTVWTTSDAPAGLYYFAVLGTNMASNQVGGAPGALLVAP